MVFPGWSSRLTTGSIAAPLYGVATGAASPRTVHTVESTDGFVPGSATVPVAVFGVLAEPGLDRDGDSASGYDIAVPPNHDPRLADLELREAARRCLWWQRPDEALGDWRRFVCYVMEYGTWEESRAIRRRFSREELREALRHAPPGVFDPASWSYWHGVAGEASVPPLPVRRIPGCEPLPATSKFTFHDTSARR